MKTYNVTIRDNGITVSRTVQAATLEAAVDVMEGDMRNADEVTAGNPDCEPRENWFAIIIDGCAECSLRGDSQDAQTWAKVAISQA